LPFSWKLTPAAFPVFTMTSPLARTEVCAGAIRVSSATGLPSAMMETQVVFSARISRVKVLSGIAAAPFATRARAPAGGVADSAWDAAVGAACKEGGDMGEVDSVIASLAGGGVVAAEIVPGESFPDDKANVSTGDALPPLGDAAGAERGVMAEAGAATGSGAGD
jgi:hypothetical protein